MTDTTTTSAPTVRVNPEERAILEAAEANVLGRTIITISAKDGEQFELWIGAPVKAISALEELGGAIPSWEK